MRTLRSLIAVLFIAVIAASCTVVVTPPAVAPDAPTITVAPVGVASTVTITAASGASIYYTLDGSSPTISSTLYSSPILIAGYGVTKTVKAIAYASALSSTVASNTVTVGSTLSLTGTKGDYVTGLSAPYSVTSDGTNVFIADTGTNRIIKRTGSALPEVFAGSGALGSSEGTGTAASFNGPVGLATDGANLYVADYYNNKIRKIVISTGVVSTFAGSGSVGFADGTGTAASFKGPEGLATDGENLYVADLGNYAIRKIVLSTGAVTTLAGSGFSGNADGTGTAASFKSPYNLATDGTNLYVADNGSGYVRKIVISTGAVTSPRSFTGNISLATDATNIYVTDNSFGEVWKFALSTFGTVGVSGDQIASGLNGPMGIASDGTYLYVADTGNNKVVYIR